MLDHAFLPIARKMFNGQDPLWESNEAFDRRSAWIDLCQMARQQSRERIVNGVLVRLEPGQVLASERFLAERWHWTRAKVRRFLVQLSSEKLQRIVTNPAHASAQAGAIITLCNYEGYNNTATTSRPTCDTTDGTTDGPPAAHLVDQIKEREERKKEEREEEQEGAARPAAGSEAVPTNGPKTDPDAVRAVWDHWLAVSGRGRSKLTPERRKKIQARLATYPVVDLCRAIDGAHRNSFYLGENDRGEYYGHVETIFKNDGTVERHLEWAPGADGFGGGLRLSVVSDDAPALSPGEATRREQERRRQAEEEREREVEAWRRVVAAEFAKLSEEEREAWKDQVRPAIRALQGSPDLYEKTLRRIVYERFGASIGRPVPEQRAA